jgi:hypothetical protein
MRKEYTLPREFAERWVKALRSGEYKQGTGTLGNAKDGYCCIGVACRIAGAPDEALVGENVIDHNKIWGAKYDLPKEITGRSDRNELVCKLTNANDIQHLNFSQIADFIEKEVEFV